MNQNSKSDLSFLGLLSSHPQQKWADMLCIKRFFSDILSSTQFLENSLALQGSQIKQLISF